MASKAELLRILKEKSLLRGNFVLASGKHSDYYIDGKRTTFDPEGAYQVGHLLLDEIENLNTKVEAVGGMSIGADPIVIAVGLAARERGYPLRVFVTRKKVKDHGTQKMIEGNFREGDKVVMVEDVMTTAGSTLQAAEIIRQAGGEVIAAMVIVDRKQGAAQNLQKEGIPLISLFSVESVLTE
jgi:orotate phosphoribosyltransferase